MPVIRMPITMQIGSQEADIERIRNWEKLTAEIGGNVDAFRFLLDFYEKNRQKDEPVR